MKLLVAVGNLSIVVNPDQSVLDLLGCFRRLVDANIDAEIVLPGFLLETENKGRVSDRLAKVVRFIGRSSNVISSFGKEENLGWYAQSVGCIFQN